jgi:hypothetical protein
MRHPLRSLMHSGTPVIDGIEFFLITDRHAAIHGALLVLAAGSMARLDLPLIPSFYPSLCTQKYAQKYTQNQLRWPCHQWINDH